MHAKRHIAFAVATVLAIAWIVRSEATVPVSIVTVPRDVRIEGLSFYEASPEQGVLIGVYREGDDFVTFEVTRGEPVSLAVRSLEGGGPYATHGCFRNRYGQPFLDIGGCVNDDTYVDIGVSDEEAAHAWVLASRARAALTEAELPGLEIEQDFLVRYGQLMP